MTSLFKRMLTLILGAVLALPMTAGAVYAGEEDPKANAVYSEETQSNDMRDRELGNANGFIPVEKDCYVVPEEEFPDAISSATPEEELPAFYRSDEQPWAQDILVRDQMDTQLCWAFTVAEAAQYSYAKEVYEKTGQVVTVPGLSAAHLGQFFFHRTDDPLGNTTGDYNESSSGIHWSLNGGNPLYAMQHLAGWSGLALEEKAPIDEVNRHILNNAVRGDFWDGSLDPFGAELAYDDELQLQESILSFYFDPDVMKRQVIEYGAVSIDVSYFKRYMNLEEIDPATGECYRGGRSFYNYNPAVAGNHAVTIVGWDDNYPKENFTHDTAIIIDENGNEIELEGEEARKVTTPENDGAWIIQNSWGSDYHDNGFFYLSYESSDFVNTWPLAYDMMPAGTWKYNFQYDGSAYCSDASDRDENGYRKVYNTAAGSRAANVFTNTTGNPISLEAVGFTAFNQGLTRYEVSVYTGLTDPNDPTSGTLAGTSVITTRTCGCKTAELEKPVTIRDKETYSIVFDFPSYTAFGTEESSVFPGFAFYAETAPGQSFFSASKKSGWVDMNEYNACFRIKGFANDTVVKEKNPLKASGKTVSVKASDLKKKAVTVKRKNAISVTGAKGKVTYKKTSGDKKITVDKKTGNITIAKGLKKDTYKVKVKVTAAGNENYEPGNRKVTVTIKVK